MKAKEKISVIIPAYNIKNYILNAVQSIVNQSYDNIEVIIIDDGSSDGTETIIDELTVNKRIRVFHKENEGVAKARMEGVLHATGEWVSFVDGDDFIDPDMYLRLLDNAHNYNADIAHCGYQMVFPSRTDFYYNTGKIVQQNNKQGLVDLLRGDYIEPGLWNKLFRRRLFDNLMFCDIIDYSIRNYEDLLMNYYLFKEAEKSVYEDWCPYHYILRSDSAATSRVNQHKMEDPLKVLKQIKQDTKDEEIIIHQ